MPTRGDPTPPLDYKRIVEILDRHEVEYVIVGGIASLHYGAVHPTMDFDAVIRKSTANINRLTSALEELGAFLRVDNLSDKEARSLPVHWPSVILESTISNLRTEAGDIDVMAGIPGELGHLVEYDELVTHGTQGSVNSVKVIFAGLSDIVISKRMANRDKDIESLPELERIMDEMACPGQEQNKERHHPEELPSN